MTTAMMLDAFNPAGDVDMQMQATGAEPWFDEARMEDDDAKSSGSVEIEMEDDQVDANTEFDMLDADFDVEVVDATQETLDSPVIDLTESSDVAPADANMPDEPVADAEVETQDEVAVDEAEPVMLPDVAVEEPFQLPQIDESADGAGSFPVEPQSGDGMPAGDNAETIATFAETAEPVATNDAGAEQQAEDAVDEASYLHGPADETEVEAQPVALEDAAADADGEGETDNVEEKYSQSGDPHEIDDGVYIDPPPAVMLFLPSEQHPEVCLFNEPSSSGSVSSSGTSTPEKAPKESQSRTVILQHMPTVYYEPLSNLFDSLRTDDIVLSLPSLEESEMVLDILDLKLKISEDNIHSREITVHDLNVLHDDTGLSGPLRLRLQFSPRFIVRYRSLLERAHKATIEDSYNGPEDYGESDNAAVENQHAEVNAYEDDQTTYQEESELQGNEENYAEPREDGTDSNEPLQQEVAAALDPSSSEVATDATEVDKISHNAADEPRTGEFSVLDADAVHGLSDANALTTSGEQRTEYEEYADPQEEGEDGELLEEAPEVDGNAVYAPEDEATLQEGAEYTDPPTLVTSEDVPEDAVGKDVGELPSTLNEQDLLTVDAPTDQLDSPSTELVDNTEPLDVNDSGAPFEDGDEPTGQDEGVAALTNADEDPDTQDNNEEGDVPWDELANLRDEDALGDPEQEVGEYADTTWDTLAADQTQQENDQHDQESGSVQSSVTLSSSKSSSFKRNHEEIDAEDFVDYVELAEESPESKRARIEA